MACERAPDELERQQRRSPVLHAPMIRHTLL
jgi:hypothetical protein